MTEKATTDSEETITDAPDEAGETSEAGGESEQSAADRPGGAAPDDGPSRSGAATGERGSSPEALEEEQIEDELSSQLDRLQAEFNDLNDRHLRLAAEFTNYRRRQENEMTSAWGRAQADLVRRFLEVLDDLQRVSGLDPAEESVTVQAIVEGIDLVERKFLRSLEEAGVEILEPVGEAFDPSMMEAMMMVPVDDGEEDNDDVVAAVFQRGYVLKGHLIRPARVSVYKAE